MNHQPLGMPCLVPPHYFALATPHPFLFNPFSFCSIRNSCIMMHQRLCSIQPLSLITFSCPLPSLFRFPPCSMPNSRIMIHQPLGGASGQAVDIEIQAKEIMYHKVGES